MNSLFPDTLVTMWDRNSAFSVQGEVTSAVETKDEIYYNLEVAGFRQIRARMQLIFNRNGDKGVEGVFVK